MRRTMKGRPLYLLAAAVAGCPAFTAVAEPSPGAPLYLVKAPFSPDQSPPLWEAAPADELPYSSLPGLLAHSAGATKNVVPLGVQSWAGSPFFSSAPFGGGGGGSQGRAVAAIALLGVKPDISEQILPMVRPEFLLNDAPSTSDQFVGMMKEVTDSVANARESQLLQVAMEFASGAVEGALTEPVAAAMPSPRPVSEVVKSFNDRFPGLNTDIFDPNDEVDAAFITEIEYVSDVFAALSKGGVGQFAGVVMGALQDITNPTKYDTACQVLKDLLTRTVIPKFLESYGNGATVAVLMTRPTPGLRKRGFLEPSHVLVKRQAPTNKTAVACPADQATCESQTTKCNGRGQCVKNKLGCFQCVCTKAVDPTTTSKTLVQWAGDACQYHYAAPQFFLLWGTGVALLLAFLAISVLVVNMGGAMSGGPTAGAGAGGIKTD